MATLKLKDCPPSLHAAILAQLKREDALLPRETKESLSYVLAYKVGGSWDLAPEISSLKLANKLCNRACLGSSIAAVQTTLGNPPCVIIEITSKVTIERSY